MTPPRPHPFTVVGPTGPVAPDPTACPKCGRDTCEGSCTTVRAFTLADLDTYVFPPRKPLLLRGTETVSLREGHLAQVVASRGTGKTWFLHSLALALHLLLLTSIGLTAVRSAIMTMTDSRILQ